MSASSCVITGAASGIGLAIVRELLGCYRAVVGVDTNASRLSELEQELGSLGKFVPLVGDVADPDSHELAAKAAERCAPLRGWVNNAGYNVIGSIHEIDRHAYE